MTRLNEKYVELFHDSFERCRENLEFFDRFYDRLLASSDEIHAIFEDVDLNRVKVMVRDAFFHVMMASSGNQRAADKLRDLGMYHGRLEIRPEHLDMWLSALLSVVEEVDRRYNADIDAAWREVMGAGIDTLKSSL